MKKEITPKNIFIVRSDRLGEFLLSLPAIKLVKLNYPESKIYLLAQKNNIDLIRGVDFIDEYIDYDEPYFNGYRGAYRLAMILRRKRIDCFIALNPKKEFHLASLLAQVRLRIGYNRKFGFCLNRKIEDKKYEALKHEAEYNFDLIRLLCKNVYTPKLDLVVDDKSTLQSFTATLDMAKKYVVIHPFTSDPSKKIATEFWISLVSGLKNSCTNNIVIIGSQDEKGAAGELNTKLNINNLTGKLSLRSLAAFFKYNCGIFIGLDSGPMHLASALNLPVTGLFKTSNSKRWGAFNTQSLIIEDKSDDGFKQRIEDIVKFTCSNLLHKI